jgi:hypothetical protein
LLFFFFFFFLRLLEYALSNRTTLEREKSMYKRRCYSSCAGFVSYSLFPPTTRYMLFLLLCICILFYYGREGEEEEVPTIHIHPKRPWRFAFLSLSSAQNIAEENEKREEEDRSWLLLGLLGGHQSGSRALLHLLLLLFSLPLLKTGPGNNKDVPQRSQHSTKKNSSDGGGQWECSIHGRATISTLFFHFLSRLRKYLMAPEFSG